MSDVFLSYSRKDTQFVREIFEILNIREREAWIDLHDIDYSVKWWEEICAGIDGANNFVFFVSPNSMESLFCHHEIQHALKHNKRVIPFVLKQVDQEALFQACHNNPELSNYEDLIHENWKMIQTIQWIDYTKINDVNLAVDALLKTVDTDPERVKLHTRLLLRLRDWEGSGRNPSGLLRGDELIQYEQWINSSRQKDAPPFPTNEQETYIGESRRAQDELEAKRIQRERLVRGLRVASSVLGVFFLLAVIATIFAVGFANNAVNAQQTSIAKEGESNTQVAVGNTQVALGNTQVALDTTKVAIIGETLTPIPPKLTMVAQTIVAGSYLIESLNLSAAANTILKTEGGNAETAALLSIRVLRKLYMESADSALVVASERLKTAPLVVPIRGPLNGSIAPDGNTFVTALRAPGKVKVELRKALDGTVIWDHLFNTTSINYAAFSPDGKYIAAVGDDFTIVLLDAIEGKSLRIFKGHDDYVQRLVFSPDGSKILSLGGGNDKTVRLWDVETGQQALSVPAGGGHASLFFFPDGLSFYTSDNVYRTEDGNKTLDANMHGGTLAISPDGNTYITGVSTTAELWSLNNRQKLQTLSGHTDSVRDAAFSKNGKWVATGSSDNTVRVWEVSTGKLLLLLSGHNSQVSGLNFSADGSKILSVGEDVRIWSITLENSKTTLDVGDGVTTFALSTDDKTILVGGEKGTTRLWNFDTGQMIKEFSNTGPDIKSVAYSPDGKMLAIPVWVDDHHSSVKLFDTSKGELLKTFTAEVFPSFIGNITFSSDSKMIFASYHDNSARLWDIDSGELLRQFSGNTSEYVGPSAYSPDGKLVTLNAGRSWWIPATGEKVIFADGTSGNVLQFSDDGTMVAVYDLENALSVWNIKTQKLINRLNLHMSVINSIAFSPDNRLLITGNTDNVARVWDISSGKVLRVLSGHTGPVTDVVFSKDGKKIITASQDGKIRTWITDYNDLIDYACARIGIDLSQVDRVNYGITDQEPTCPQFGRQSIPQLPTTTPMPTHGLPPLWTPMATPTKNAGK